MLPWIWLTSSDGPGHVVLDEGPALEHGDLGGLRVDVDAHEVAADGPALALPAPPALRASSSSSSRPPVGSTASTGVDGLAALPPLGRGAWPPPWPPRRRRRRRGRARPGGGAAWRALGRRRRPPAAGGAAAGPAWCRRSAACGPASAARAPHQRGVGGLDGLRPALAGRVGQLRVAVVVAGRRRRSPASGRGRLRLRPPREPRRRRLARVGVAPSVGVAGVGAPAVGGARARPRRSARSAGRRLGRVAGGVAGGDLGHRCVPFS